MADERIATGIVGIEVDDAKYRADLRDDERLFDSFTNKVRRTKAVSKVELETKKFTFAAGYVKGVLADLAKAKATATMDMNTRAFKRGATEVRFLLNELRLAKRRLDGTLGDDKATQKWLRSLGGVRVQLGFFSATLRQATRGLVVLGPILEAVAGSFIALAGSMGSAALGGMAAFGAGLAGMVGGLTLVKSAIQPTINGVNQAFKAQAAYNDAVRKFGVESETAQKKLKQLNSVMAHIPAESRASVREMVALRSEWKNLTRDTAREQVFATLSEGVKTARANLGNFAAQTNSAMKTMGAGIRGALQYLREDEGSGAMNTILSGFNAALPPLMKGLGQLGALLLRIAAAAQPAFVGLVQSFADWATKMNQANSDSNTLGSKIDSMVAKFRVWMGLLGAVGGLVKAVFGGGSESGTDFALSITNVLNRWTAFLNTAKGQTALRDFFAQAVTMAKQFFTVIGAVISILYSVTVATRPLAAAIVTIASAVGQVVAAFAGTDFGKGVILAAAGAWVYLRTRALAFRAAGIAVTAANYAVTASLAVKAAAMKTAAAAMAVGRGAAIAAAFGIRAVGLALRFAMGPIGLIITAVALFAAGLVQLYKRNETFRNAVDTSWRAIKSVVTSVAGAIWDGVRAVWRKLEDLFSGNMLSRAIQKGFGAAKDIAVGLVNAILSVVDEIPGVDIGRIGGGGGGRRVTGGAGVGAGSGGGANRRGPLAQARGGWHAAAAGGMAQGAAEGGKVTAPIIMMGEEAPKHPEWVIPENPAYRKRALSLWAMAGKNIGAFAKGGKVQGYAKGGLIGDLKDMAGSAFSALANGGKALLGMLPSNPFKGDFAGLGSWMLAQGGNFIKKKASDALSFLSSKGSGKALGKGAPANLGAAASLARSMGLSITSTTGGTHAPGSYHYQGRAIDVSNGSGPTPQMAAFYRAIKRRYGRNITELFYDPLGGIKHGKEIGAIGGHSDHVHVAFQAGGRRGRIATAGGWGKSKRAQEVIAAAARKYGIDPAILWGLYGAESGFGTNMGPSSAGARGPFQFMPGTAKSYGIDPMNFKQAAFAAAKYLATYKKRGTAGMLAAYNAGPAGNPNNPETQAYIPKVKRLAGTWPGGAGGTTTGTTGDDPTVGGLDPREEKEKRRLEAKIKRNKATLRKLRERLSKAPRGKKGAGARRSIQQQITKLNNANAVMRESIQSLGGAVTEGATNTAETRLQEADTGLQEAQNTPALKDDVEAIGALTNELDSYESERRARLKTITGFLRGKLTKDERAKYLRERQQIQRTLTGIENRRGELDKTRVEALVGQRFGGGAGAAGIAETREMAELTPALEDDISSMQEEEKYLAALLKGYQGKTIGGTPGRRGAWGKKIGGTKGTKFAKNPKLAAQTATKLGNLREALAKAQFQNQMNPLDFYLAQAESTVGLGDDIGVMNQQLVLWQGELARQSKKRNWAGMTEAQNAINSLQQRIQSAVVQQQTDDINNSLDSMQLELRDAANSISLWDDVNSLNRNIYYLSIAQQKAAAYGHWQRYNELAVEIRENQKRVREATWAAEEAPMEARRALAALTESTDDDRAATQEMLGYAERRLAWAQAAGDFGEITKQAGIVKSLRDELKQEETGRIEMIRSLSEQRQNLYRTMGSNQIGGGMTPVGTNVIVNNYYKSMPMDAHTWSRDLSFEIRAAT